MWSYEASRGMTNGDPVGWIFLSHPQMLDFFSCSSLNTVLLYVL